MVSVDAAISKINQRCRPIAKSGYHRLRPTSNAHRDVIFIAGQQRSGTNMMMDVLERHWNTDVYHETDARAFDNYVMRDLGVIRDLFRRSRAKHFVIKALCELQHLRDYLDAFPHAKAIWIIRYYGDVCRSMARQFSSTAEALRLMRQNPDLGGWRGERMSASTHALLRDCVDDDTDEISAAAFQWYMRNRLFFDQGLDGDRRVEIVFYEDLVTNPVPTFAKIFGFLAIDFNDAAVGDVFATSIRNGELPPIEPRIDALCRELFERFCAIAKPSM